MGIASVLGIDPDELARRSRAHVLDQLAQGHSISYRDPDHPGEIIREYPDGRRTILAVADDGTVSEVREIPPRKDRA